MAKEGPMSSNGVSKGVIVSYTASLLMGTTESLNDEPWFCKTFSTNLRDLLFFHQPFIYTHTTNYYRI